MMEGEGAPALLPATLSETPRSEGPKKYIRNVEAEGSNPFTSTTHLVVPLRKPTISWAFVLCQRIFPDLSTAGLSTEYVDGLSRLPY